MQNQVAITSAACTFVFFIIGQDIMSDLKNLLYQLIYESKYSDSQEYGKASSVCQGNAFAFNLQNAPYLKQRSSTPPVNAEGKHAMHWLEDIDEIPTKGRTKHRFILR